MTPTLHLIFKSAVLSVLAFQFGLAMRREDAANAWTAVIAYIFTVCA